MARICIIGAYFGQFPTYFDLWFNSCAHNKDIDFLIITDQSIRHNSDNIKVMNRSFKDFKNLVQSKFDFTISLERPFKLCDYRPAFGLIFEEFLKPYDYWGHCDFDMIFGDLRKYLTDELLNAYDKVLPLGHLSLYRNSIENNNRFRTKGSIVGDYQKVLTTDKGFGFDELSGIYQIYKVNGFPMFEKRIFADISSKHKRFRLARNDMNYKHQIFSYHHGKVLREYYLNRKYSMDEFIYIHIKKPKNIEMKVNSEQWNSFYITHSGFYPKQGSATLSDIQRYNPYPGIIFEKFEIGRYFLDKKVKRLLRKARGLHVKTVFS